MSFVGIEGGEVQRCERWYRCPFLVDFEAEFGEEGAEKFGSGVLIGLESLDEVGITWDIGLRVEKTGFEPERLA